MDPNGIGGSVCLAFPPPAPLESQRTQRIIIFPGRRPTIKLGAYPESSSNHQKLIVGAASSRGIK